MCREACHAYMHMHMTSACNEKFLLLMSLTLLRAQVIDDVANMGFSRHEVRAVVTELMDSGQSIDLNVVLDRLMNGRR